MSAWLLSEVVRDNTVVLRATSPDGSVTFQADTRAGIDEQLAAYEAKVDASLAAESIAEESLRNEGARVLHGVAVDGTQGPVRFIGLGPRPL